MNSNKQELDNHAVAPDPTTNPQSQSTSNCVEFPNPSPAPAKRPRSEAQIAASRENGKKSQGPISPEGKRISSRNSTKHGLSITNCAYSNQYFPGIELIAENLRIEFNPQTPAEAAIVDTMTLARWQQHSIPVETAALIDHIRDTQISNPSFAEPLGNAKAQVELLQDNQALNHFHRYLVSAERRFSRALRDLEFLRKHSHTLHEVESAAAHLEYKSAPIAETTLPEAETAPSEPSGGPQHSALQIEPENPPINKPDPEPDSPQYSSTYSINKSPADKNSAIASSTKPLDAKDPWDALFLIQKTLLNFPEAHTAVAQTLRANEKAG